MPKRFNDIKRLLKVTDSVVALFSILAMAALCQGCTDNGKSDTTRNAKDSIGQVVDSAVKPVMLEYNIAGMSIGITINGQRYFYNYGLASKETRQKVTDETLFEIGSVSKTFTATLAAYAQINGFIELGDPVSKYLPSLHGSAFDSVQLLDLGTHTAGGLPLQLPDAVKDSVQLMKYYKDWRPDYLHGTYRVYSNPSIGLLGIVTARSMRQPFTDLIEKLLFPKLGMSHSFINVPVKYSGDYAEGYNKADSPVHLNPAILSSEAYGIKSCTKDLVHYAEENMREFYLTEQIQRAITATHTGYFTSGVLTQDLIWEQYNYPVDSNKIIVGNSGAMSQNANEAVRLNPILPPQENVVINKTGSTNGFGSYILFIPSRKIGIVILANKAYPNGDRVRLALRILAELEKHS